MADDNRIKLGVDLGDTTYALAELSTNLKNVKAAAQGVADTYEVLAGAGSNYAAVESRVDSAVAKAVERTRSQQAINRLLEENTAVSAKAAKATEGVGKAAENASDKTKGFNNSILNASRGFQDFLAGWQSNGVQGAFTGISNNLESVAKLVGGGAGLAVGLNITGALLPIVAGGLRSVYDEIRKWGSDTDLKGLEGLIKSLQQAKDQIDAIKAADVWNLETIQKYNQMLQSQAQIEKDIAERKKHKNDYEAFMASQAPEDKARSEELRKGFAEVFAGQGKELQAELIKGMDAQAEFTRDQLRKEMAGIEVLMKQARGRGDNATANKYGERIKAIDKQIADIGDDINRRAIDMIAEASAGTDRTKQKRAIDQMRGLVGDATRVGLDMVVERDWVDRPDVETDAERNKRIADKRKADADKKARRARQDEEIAQAAQTPEDEAKVVEAFNYIKRQFPKLKATEQQLVGIAEEARKAYDENPDISAAQAARRAVNSFQAGRNKSSDAVQLDAIRGQIDAGTGGAWNQDQVAEAAKRTQDLVKQGFDLQWSMGAVVGRMQAENAELAGQVAALNGFVNQLQQGQQVTRGRLRRNRR